MGLPLFARAQAEPPKLRPYQLEAIEAIRARYAAGDRATLLVLATGLGKTRTFAEICMQVVQKGGRALVLAHRTELIEQAAESLEAMGLDVAIEQAEQHAGRQSVVVSSVQSLQRKRLERWPRDWFSLVVIDESHRAAAKSYRAILDHFDSAKVLGVTATPDRGDGKGLWQLFDSCAYRMEIAAGIKAGWLAPISAQRVVVDGLDLSEVRTVAGDLNQGDLDLAMRAPEAVHGVAEPLVELSEGRQTLVFAVTVEHAYALAEAVNGIAPGTAEALDGNASRDRRADAVRRYKSGDLRMLVNVQMYTEGFDAPDTSCVALARPTQSRGLMAQMIGRGTRLAPGKKELRVLDFAGIAGKHSLVGPADVLAGEALDPESRQEVEERLSGDGARDVSEVLGEAEAAVKERQERERKKKEREKPPPIEWNAVDVDIFGEATKEAGNPAWVGVEPTEGQVAYLEKRGLKVDGLDKAKASQLIDELKVRQARNLCTYKQARMLARHGIDTRYLGFQQASELIDELINRYRWRPRTTWVEGAKRVAEEARRRAEGVAGEVA